MLLTSDTAITTTNFEWKSVDTGKIYIIFGFKNNDAKFGSTVKDFVEFIKYNIVVFNVSNFK